MPKSLNSKNKKVKISIRLAKKKDENFILSLHNENVVKKRFFSKKKISLEDHKNWFRNKIKEKMLFVCSHLEDVGYIRYDFLKKKNLSISIAIKEKFKRHGFGKLMLIKTLNKKNIINKNIYAFVKKKNFTSKNFFLKMGFVKKKDGTYLLKHK